MIAGILSPSFSCFPKDLKENFEENWIVEGKNLPEIIKAFEMKTKLFLRKMIEDFDLLVYVIRLPDAFSHNVIGDEKMISNYIQLAYKKIDDFLGVIMKENNFDNLIIFSGFPDFLIVLNDKYILTKEPSFFIKRRTEVFNHTKK